MVLSLAHLLHVRSGQWLGHQRRSCCLWQGLHTFFFLKWIFLAGVPTLEFQLLIYGRHLWSILIIYCRTISSPWRNAANEFFFLSLMQRQLGLNHKYELLSWSTTGWIRVKAEEQDSKPQLEIQRNIKCHRWKKEPFKMVLGPFQSS